MKRLLLLQLIFIFLVPIKAETISKKNLTESEDKALSALCKIGLNADGGIWKNKNINTAIATIKWGENYPDNIQATAYKTCNSGGYLK
tara:strand:- start:167 stop:430 length:264 start_codon:yes stop_codon:yes gene_type:complete